MLGALVSLLFAAGAACFGHLLVRRLTDSLDPALAAGLAGLAGLGAIGTLTLFVGLVPGGLGSFGAASMWLLVALSGALCWKGMKPRISLRLPKGADALFLLAVAVALLFALVSVLAPSDMAEWDSLAYHLAVPKIWLQAHQIQPITFIHQSNFPLAVDNLYIWGLFWGGEPGAKAFTLAFAVFGTLAVFGLARQVYGGRAGWWAALAWCTIPAVLWLSGTGYIDVQNGLYAGLGILFAGMLVGNGSLRYAWLAGIMMGLAAGSKYTGFETLFAACLVLVVALAWAPKTQNPKPKVRSSLGLIVGLALVIACPWYVKNLAWTGNPVYPFFYSRFGGNHWSQWQTDIYNAEQQSFGVGRETPPSSPIEPQRIGHAILGLAYQPGRFINPGETSGQGFPVGAIGFAVIASLLLWLIAGRAGAFEGSVLAAVLVSLAMWFVLSEQSRYIIALGVPLSVLAGGGVTRLRAGPVLAAAIVIQALAALYVVKSMRFDTQIQILAGKISVSDYMNQAVPFYDPAQELNRIAGGGRVALYDEVFGYLLDVPYLWANPGHSNELGYTDMRSS
ncbi:MAG TPA: hypothetical protein VMI31_06480, partial [Fimbriimonadaceae bacterium]|nr:hypothetical protein [Fimbriimonadaceae bacterium]